MESNRNAFFMKREHTQFKRKGGSKKGKKQSSSREQSSRNPDDGDTVYRILCPSKRIGSVLGKGGGIIKALREETQSKITVSESVPGSDERVIMTYSSPTKIPTKLDRNEDCANNSDESYLEPHCAAQDALLKVHDRVIEDDLLGGTRFEEENENTVVTSRLLVPNNMVGCLLGKGGDVIQRLRSETSASIRVLPSDHLPACAMSTDELVQISGKPDIVKKALFVVSTLLHQNPRKDKPPLAPYGGQNSRPPRPSMLPPGDPVWPHSNPPQRGMPSMPWIGEYGSQPHGFASDEFDGGPPELSRDASGEFSMKILCSVEKIGSVIGKGGVNVKQLQQESGASIHVEDASAVSEERVIRVTSFEALWNPRSQTIEAILHLQDKTCEFSEKGMLTTRLLVPSGKVGCILGQGGHIINEMRRRTQADIRIYSKDDKPKCASENEELVQISGNYDVAKEALAEIASRLRTRCLRDADSGEAPAPAVRVQGFGPLGNHFGGPTTSRLVGTRNSGGYERFKDGRLEFDRLRYPVPSAAPGYPNFNRSMEIPDNGGGAVIGIGGNSISRFGEVSGRMELQDSEAGGSERVFEIHGPTEHFNAASSRPHFFNASSGQDYNPQQAAYLSANSQCAAYPSANSQCAAYPSANSQRAAYPSANSQRAAYANAFPQQGVYPDSYPQQHPSINTQQGGYTHIDSPPQGAYPSQQSGYSPLNSPQGPYHSQQIAYSHPSTYQSFSAQQAYQY